MVATAAQPETAKPPRTPIRPKARTLIIVALPNFTNGAPEALVPLLAQSRLPKGIRGHLKAFAGTTSVRGVAELKPVLAAHVTGQALSGEGSALSGSSDTV